MYISLVQVPIAQQPWPSPPPQLLYNFSDELMQKDGVGFGVIEEQKRRKKSEEVLKIIKRARQRREEEENRYRREGEGCLI